MPLTPAGAAVVTLLAAVALDLAFGDPPNRFHPVAWLGTGLERGRRALCHGSPRQLLLGGAALVVGIAGLAGGAGWIIERVAARLGGWGIVVEALALTSALSLRGLAEAALAVGRHLGQADLPAARLSVGRDLVSRPTADLDEADLVSATVESVAENLTDAFVGPVCFFLAFGLPGAAAYRAINTADAMLGYREGALEHFGKAAARLDDLLNLLPARLSGYAIVLGAAVAGGDAGRAWSVMRSDRGRTASPNAGWTMAAMAGALGVTLEKAGAYRLGDGRPPGRVDIGRSVRILGAAAALTLGLAATVRIALG